MTSDLICASSVLFGAGILGVYLHLIVRKLNWIKDVVIPWMNTISTKIDNKPL